MRDIPPLFEHLEHREDLPGTFVDLETLAVLQHARNILVETAAGDVADSVHIALADHFQHLLHIDLRRGEENLAEFLVAEFGNRIVIGKAGVGDDLADQAEAVGVHAAGGDAYQDVSYFHFRPVNEFGFLNDTGGIPRDIVFPILVHARHFGRFTAHEGAARLAASFRHAGDDGLHLGRDVVTEGYIVQEDKGFSALCEHIVHAHRHGVDADGIVLVHREGDLELGAHTVGAAHEDRLLDAQGREVEHAAEGADVPHRPDPARGCHMLFDPADHFIPRFEVHARFFVGFRHINR